MMITSSSIVSCITVGLLMRNVCAASIQVLLMSPVPTRDTPGMLCQPSDASDYTWSHTFDRLVPLAPFEPRQSASGRAASSRLRSGNAHVSGHRHNLGQSPGL